MFEITLGLLVITFLAAVFAGFVGALFGIGGGIVIVPFLSVFLGLPIHEAIAVSIVSVVATSNAGGSSYVEQRITNIKLAMFLEVFTTAGALLGSFVALLLHSWTLFLIFGSLLIYVSATNLNSVRKNRSNRNVNVVGSSTEDSVSRYLGLRGSYYDQAEKKTFDYVTTGSGKGATLSVGAGALSGLLGVGGGVIKVAAMTNFMKVPIKASIATSKFMIGVTGVTGALLYFIAGLVNVYLLAPVALGTTIGATSGTWIMNRIRPSVLVIAFTILVLYFAYTMFAQGLATGFGITLPGVG